MKIDLSELTPVQRKLLDEVLKGGVTIFHVPRRMGVNTLRKALAEVQPTRPVK